MIYYTIFKKILNMIPRRRFEYHAFKHGYNKYTKHFSVWNQFFVNLYAQASGKKSLRDIETGLRVQHSHWYHLGLKNISRSQLSYSNNKRDYIIFRDLYYHLFSKCIDIMPKHKFKFKNPISILDSTVIDLCLSIFPWAKFRKTKGALKIHTLLDLRGSIPSFIVVSHGKRHDIRVAKECDLPICSDSILVVDKGYYDFEWFYELTLKEVYFVTRAKNNIDYQVIGQHKEVKNKNIISDTIIKLNGIKTSLNYPEKLRLVNYLDKENNKIYSFLTNNFNLSASTIAQIYKARWDIELFFKWIKQNLKIKTFMGTSKNAVMTQIYTAMIYYLLIAYIKYQTKYKYSLLHFTRVIKEALFKKMDIIDLLNISPNKIKQPREPSKQRILFNLQAFY